MRLRSLFFNYPQSRGSQIGRPGAAGFNSVKGLQHIKKNSEKVANNRKCGKIIGGGGAYSQHRGFSKCEYMATGKVIEGFKVIQHKTDDHASLPQMSNTLGTVGGKLYE